MDTQVIAYQKFIRQSPRKLRLLADMIRQLPVAEALIQLELSDKKGAQVMSKVLTQAKANAINTKSLVPDSLKIHEILIEEGPTYKRWQPVSRGRAHPIMKRTSHIKITVKGDTQSKSN